MTSLVLASRSAVRCRLLAAAGVAFETESPDVDETAAKRGLEGATPREVAERLADAKAADVSGRRPGALVIGADQTLELDGRLFDKAESPETGVERLRALRGRVHVLHAALACARDGAVVWRCLERARLTMRRFSDEFLDGYARRNPDALVRSVGAYELEGEGAQLFEAVEGDYFSILGLPLLPLLGFLRAEGVIPA